MDGSECVKSVSVDVLLDAEHQCVEGNGYPTESYDLLAHITVGDLNDDREFVDMETGWSEGVQLNTKGSWASKSTFDIACA